jgi:integrative and conjugative element protein (TIGR02256 family)
MSGETTDILRSPRARQLIDYVRNAVDAPFAHIDSVGFDEGSGRDFVDITVEPQLAQDRAVAIRDIEPVRLLFWAVDDHPPTVLSRREDFPLDLVHTNFEGGVNGRCLCIWEENWHDLGRGLTPQALIERIRNWFTRTAAGLLHEAGQPLEPMIPTAADTLIIPAGPPPTTWHVVDISKRGESWTVVVDSQAAEAGKEHLQFPIFALELPPQVHGAMKSRPYTFDALRQLVEPMEINLGQVFGDWLIKPDQLQLNQRRPLLIVTVPKQRQINGPVEVWETWAFWATATLGELGEAFGRTFSGESQRSSLRITAVPPAQLPDIGLMGWRVVQRLDRAAARRFAGNPAFADRILVGVGAGAIGSNVIVGTTRAGIGTWTVIDDDTVLPHNTVRQAQTNRLIGGSKALTARLLADLVLAEGGNSHIEANILEPGEAADEIGTAVAAADLVVDFSASPSVLAKLADDDTSRRTASCFFNPAGSDLIVLAEDAGRELRLDEIEAQYFLAAAADPRLGGHLASARVDFIRYANACQDLSRPLPPWQVQTLCGIASGRLLKLLEEPEAAACAWRLDVETAAVEAVALPLAKVHRCQFEGWRVTLTVEVVRQMQALRQTAAPNETGGVLIGSFDVPRGVVHIVAALPAPADSQQAPTYFVRGARELTVAIDAISRCSVGTLGYVGEWHSHPDGAAARPSRDDEAVFGYLKTHLGPTGTPYVMAICGKHETWLRAGWQSREQAEKAICHGCL